MKQRRFNANNSLRNQHRQHSFFRDTALLRHLVISMSYTGKIPQITQVDQLCCADTRRDKICRLCNTAVFIQYFFHLRSCIHCFTRFRYKIKHTFVSIVFEIIIADNMPPRKNKITHTFSCFACNFIKHKFFCRLFAHYLLARAPASGYNSIDNTNVRGFHIARYFISCRHAYRQSG